jgi:hypothetical protein
MHTRQKQRRITPAAQLVHQFDHQEHSASHDAPAGTLLRAFFSS